MSLDESGYMAPTEVHASFPVSQFLAHKIGVIVFLPPKGAQICNF